MIPIKSSSTPNSLLNMEESNLDDIQNPMIAPGIPDKIAGKITFHLINFLHEYVITAIKAIHVKNIKFMPWAWSCFVSEKSVRYITRIPPPPSPIAPSAPERSPATMEIILFIVSTSGMPPKY